MHHLKKVQVFAFVCLFSMAELSAQTLPEGLTSAASLAETSPTKTLFLPGENATTLSVDVTQLHGKQARKGWELFSIETSYHKGKLNGFFLTYKLK